MSFIALNPMNAFANTKDEASIKTIVESVGSLADTGNFESLEELYANEVEMDYTSLTGGNVEVKSPKAIMTQWAAVLPGFDKTRHEVSDIEVSSNGKTATASANVTATHWAGDLFWEVKGTYLYKLKKDISWKITAHKFTLKDEKGTRDVFAAAMNNTKANPSDYIKRQQTQQAVRDFLDSLEKKDMEKFASIWAEDAVQDMPFSPKGFPRRVSGKANLIKHYAAWPKNSEKADFTSKLVFYPMKDPEMVFVEFKGDVDIIPTKRKYKQHYGGLFHVEKSKIKLFREYFNPEPFKYAFGLEEK